MDEKDFFRQIDFSLEITPLKNRKLVEITPCIEVISEKSATLIVSFEVDGIELIESARIAVSPGKSRIPLREKLRIGNPSLWHVHTAGRPSLYEMSLIFYKDGAECHRITKRTGIRFPELKDGRLFFLNGDPIRLCRMETVSPENLEALCAAEHFNCMRVPDTHEALDELLELCDRNGIAVVLELTGERSISLLEVHPSVCFFTATENSAGYSVYKDAASALPFFPAEAGNIF